MRSARTTGVREAGVRAIYWILPVAAVLATALILIPRERETPREPSLSVAAALSSDTIGYARAAAPRPFQFPSDHGPHPDFRTEWWYYTGNLVGRDGRLFAYQFTVFRTALTPPAGPASSPQGDASDGTWATRQLYMAHFGLTDARSGEHVAVERFSRGAAGLAGADADPYRVWLEDWEIRGFRDADSVRIVAGEDDFGIDVALGRTKPIVLQGDRGFDQKGPEPGNASYYFSMTRMATSGSVRIGGTSYSVEGWSWMDREWSTSALSEDQVGWDWFSLQLGNDVDVMYYRLRRDDGSTSPFSSGSIVDPVGEIRTLQAGDVRLDEHDTWTSPSTGIRYPSRWSLKVPSTETDLEIEPLVADQELDLSIRYWEGAVRVRGTFRGQPVEGFGFVEMTGYGEERTP